MGSKTHISDRKRFSMVAIAVLMFSVLAVVALVGGGKLKRVLSKTKLTADVTMLNNAVQAYRSQGGKFGTKQNIESVISALKNNDTNQRLPGFSGAVDKRLIWTMQTADDALTDSPRVMWDQEKGRFEVRYEGGPGVALFKLDDTNPELAGNKGDDQTGDAFEFSEDSGWDYRDAEKKAVIEPTRVELAGASKTAKPEDSLDRIEVTLNSSDFVETDNRLLPPAFSIPGGSYPSGDFDLEVTLENPNPVGSSTITYSIDYGPWKTFEGEPIAVQAGETLIANSKSSNSKNMQNSAIETATYELDALAKATTGYTAEVETPESHVEEAAEPLVQETPEEAQFAEALNQLVEEEPETEEPQSDMQESNQEEVDNSPRTATLSFADQRVMFEGAGNHYFTDIDGTGTMMGLLLSEPSKISRAFKSTSASANGDTCAFWFSEGLGSESTTITLDFSENPALAAQFMVYNVDVVLGGDKVTIRAFTNKGTVLSDPEFVYSGNTEGGTSYHPDFGEADVAVTFSPPEEEAITSITLKWEGSTPSEKKMQSIGLGEITFSFLPQARRNSLATVDR